MPDRAAHEKTLLAARDFGHERHEMLPDPLGVVPGVPSHAEPPERFALDAELPATAPPGSTFAAEERARRLARRDAEEAELARRGARDEEREAARWQSQEDAWRHEQERVAALQQGAAGLKNRGSLPVNPLNLAYDDSEAGRKLRAADEETKRRARERAAFLHSKLHADHGYDLLTGVPKGPQPGAPRADA